MSARWDDRRQPAVLEDATPRCTVVLVALLLMLLCTLAATL